ncbi:MAG TPA: hypothetical protein VEY93_13135 [Longimicrobium sp.]|nr:hypothetical protein [Longimicrobium sp.]
MHGLQRETLLVVNTQKLDLWCRTIIAAPVGDRICLTDSDTFLVNSRGDAWDLDFDIAYTVRDYIIPINAGVLFVRVTPESKAFMQRWRDVNAAMYPDVPYHLRWKEKYGGMTPGERGQHPRERRPRAEPSHPPLPRVESRGPGLGRAVTRVLHVKSGLRELIFRGDVGPPQYPGWTNAMLMPLADRWKALEREAEEAAKHAAVPRLVGVGSAEEVPA